MEKILSKIQKLLNLSKSSNEHEAAAALQLAQKLMAEHDISIVDLDFAKLSSKECKDVIKSKQLYAWSVNLACLVRDAFCVEIVRSYKSSEDFYGWGGSTITFIGVTHKVEVAAYCYEVLSRSITEARKEFNKRTPSCKDKWKLSDAFCEGWVNAVKSKVVVLAMGEEEAKLVAVYTSKLMGELTPSTASSKVSSYKELEAMHEGKLAGKDVNLHHGVGGSETKAISVSS